MRISHKKILLKEVATFLNGYAFKPSDWSKEGLPIIRIQNLTGTNRDFNYYNGNYNKKYLVENGDILISWSASLGIFLWENTTGILNQHIFKVIFDKNIEIDKIYFLHCMKFLIKKIEKNIHGSTMKHITRPEFEKIKFPIYEIDIQRKISKKLIYITKIIENNKKLLSKMEELSKSLFTRMFGDIKTNDKNWEILEIKEVSNILTRGKTPKYTSLSNIFVINQACIYWDKIKYKNIKYHLEEENLLFLKNKDILINSTGTGTLGRMNIINNIINEKFTIDSHVMLLRLKKEKALPIYFINIFMGEEYQKELILKCVNGSTNQIELSKEKFAKFKIPVPPIELQNKFAERIEKIEKLKFTIWKIILKVYKTLKKKGVESN